MAQSGVLIVIYGIIIIIIIFLTIHMYYSVKYMSGQKLHLNATNNLFSGLEAGTNKIGMYDTQQQPKFGQMNLWPSLSNGFKPNKFGSTVTSGGMRPRFNIPAETDVGWWGYTPNPVRQVSLDIYDNSSNNGIGNKYVSPVGWWNA
jgi:hypothetical protein